MKLLIKILGILIVLLLVAVFLVGYFLDGIVKKGIETAGPKIAKVDVKLDGVNISLLSGSGSIHGLVVGNPEGYKTPQALKVNDARLVLKPSSLASSKLVIKELHLRDPEITIEGGMKDNNLTKIQANVEAFAAGEKSDPNAPKKILQVDDFLVSGAKVHIAFSLFGDKPKTISIPDIHLTNLGQGEDGITPGELAKRFSTEVTKGVLAAIPAAIADLGKGVTDAAKGLGKEAGKSVEKVTKGIGELFKK